MSFEKIYTNINHVLTQENKLKRNPDTFFLFNPTTPNNPDVHKVPKSCIAGTTAEGVGVPCNVISGDYHGGDKGFYFERSDAQLGCGEPIDTFEFLNESGESLDPPAKGWITDGSVYSDFGVTIGSSEEPTDNESLFINKVDESLNFPNIVLGAPFDKRQDPKYKKLDFTSDTDDKQYGVSFNQGNEYIDKYGRLKTTVHIIKGRLKIEEWDLWADFESLEGDEPCTPGSSVLYEHECQICNARADNAETTVTDRVNHCYDCQGYFHYSCAEWGDYDECIRWTREDDGSDYTPGSDPKGLMKGSSHPCGRTWVVGDDGQGGWDNSILPDDEGLEACLSLIHANMNKSSTAEDNIKRYREDCYNECNEGDSSYFEDGHPSFASCKDSRYEEDGGRLPDAFHACGIGSTQDSKKIRIPLNISS